MFYCFLLFNIHSVFITFKQCIAISKRTATRMAVGIIVVHERERQHLRVLSAGDVNSAQFS